MAHEFREARMMHKHAPLPLCLLIIITGVLVAGCASRALDTIPPERPEPGTRHDRRVDPDAPAQGAPGVADPANRAEIINAGGPDGTSPGGPHPQPASTAGGTGDTRGLVRSGSPD
jgi:hypothetical protein